MALSNLVIMITTTVTTIIMVVIALNQTTLEQLAKYRFVIAPAAPAFDQHRHPTAGRDYEVAAATGWATAAPSEAPLTPTTKGGGYRSRFGHGATSIAASQSRSQSTRSRECFPNWTAMSTPLAKSARPNSVSGQLLMIGRFCPARTGLRHQPRATYWDGVMARPPLLSG